MPVPTASPNTSPTLGARCSLRRITKVIGSHRILNQVNLDLHMGEVHVLVGANGAGKSTLIRILSGADTDFEGELWVEGKRLDLKSPRDGRRQKIHVIYQELSLVNCLSATDNWLLWEEEGPFSWLNRDSARKRVIEQCRQFGLKVDPELPLEHLTLAERQLLEIARASSEPSQVLVLDEPTSALSETEASRLLDQLDRLRLSGTAILYVSHRMEEIYKIADRISVLRDGSLVLTRPARDLPRDEMVRALAGDDLADAVEIPGERSGIRLTIHHHRLVLRGVCTNEHPTLKGVDLEANEGEILGICGLAGSGGTELLEVIGGARRPVNGKFEWSRKPFLFASPREALAHGFAYLPNDRHKSVFYAMSVRDNAELSSLSDRSAFHLLRRSLRTAEIARLADSVALDPSRFGHEALTLSGGNQQKVALLRCLLTEPKVLLLDEPTRGVDVAAKQAIHSFIKRVAAHGATVLVHSSELDELLALCHQVLVLRQGRSVAIFGRTGLDRARLLSAMMGHL